MADDVPPLADLIQRIEGGKDPSPGAQVGRAHELSRQLADRGDQLVVHFVAEAREGGCSWTEIGNAFGMSKQAAQKRYSSTDATPAVGTWPGKWTIDARRTLDGAVEHARVLRHECVGTEHVLLALLAEPGPVSEILGALGVFARDIDARLVPGPSEDEVCPRLMPRLKQALELALRLGERHGAEGRANVEHLLVAIVQVPGSFATQLLRDQGVGTDSVQRAIADRLSIAVDALDPPRRRRRGHGLRRTA